jgi:hypothetical protein
MSTTIRRVYNLFSLHTNHLKVKRWVDQYGPKLELWEGVFRFKLISFSYAHFRLQVEHGKKSSQNGSEGRAQSGLVREEKRPTDESQRQTNEEREKTFHGSFRDSKGKGENEEIASLARVAVRGVHGCRHGEDGTSRDSATGRRSGAGGEIAGPESCWPSGMLPPSSGADFVFDSDYSTPVLVIYRERWGDVPNNRQLGSGRCIRARR